MFGPHEVRDRNARRLFDRGDSDGPGCSCRDRRKVWGESWLYDPANLEGTVRILATMAGYISHIDDKFGLDNIMALELLNEPWAYLVSGIIPRSTYLVVSESRHHEQRRRRVS